MIKVISKLLEDGWNVAYRQLPEGEILGDTNTPFCIIPNTWRTWEADPFVFQYDGKIYIFADFAIGLSCPLMICRHSTKEFAL